MHNVDTCLKCGEKFSEKNTHSDAGWRETFISGFCEDCFDEVTAEPKEDEETE